MMRDEEIARLRILNDIYRNENDYLKMEYKKLHELFVEEENKHRKKSLVRKIVGKIKGIGKHE